MTTHTHKSSQWLTIIILFGILCITLPPISVIGQTTNPNPDATWAAWGLAVEFPNQQPRVRFATYVGDDTPKVLDSTPLQDITGDCTVHGTLTYAGESAIFDGNTYIECEIPSLRTEAKSLAPHLAVANLQACDCLPDQSPFWVSADLTLESVAASNPIFDASEVGFTFDLPSNGANAKTRVTQSSGTFLSPPWTVDAAGKRILAGRYGSSVVAIADYFNGLQYLTDPNWKAYFTNQVTGNMMGQWIESPGAGWRTPVAPNYTLNTNEATVYIGYDAATGSMFNGTLNKLRIDPGCKGS